MAAYRCQHCTLVRCDAPNETCGECLRNIGAGCDTAIGTTYTFTVDLGGAG